jgi:GNAT superfamily N-acetyltransferase
MFQNLQHDILNDIHNKLIDSFDCVVEDKKIQSFSSKKRKKFLAHSNKLNEFLKTEALIEQNQSLNTTHLFIDNGVLVGFVSLCSDCLRLDIEERESLKLTLFNIPALKIARLGVHKSFQGHNFGKVLIDYSVYIADQINKDYAGIKFLTIDCYEHRVSYYEKFGFKENRVQAENRKPDNPKSFRLNINEYLENYVKTSD